MNNFIKLFDSVVTSSNILLEGQNETRSLAVLKKRLPGIWPNANPDDELVRIADALTNKDTNNKHLPKLIDYYLDGTDLNIVKQYYNRFISNTKIKNTDIFKYKTFHDFEQIVDSTATPIASKVATKEITDPPIYEDSNIRIFLGSDINRCVKFGQGNKYGFCISRSDSGNLFHGYRSKEATFYFIYFKTKQAAGDAPADLIVVHVYPNNELLINYAIPNVDTRTSWDEIFTNFPALRAAKDILVPVKHTPEESHIYIPLYKKLAKLQI